VSVNAPEPASSLRIGAAEIRQFTAAQRIFRTVQSVIEEIGRACGAVETELTRKKRATSERLRLLIDVWVHADSTWPAPIATRGFLEANDPAAVLYPIHAQAILLTQANPSQGDERDSQRREHE
jgi:hypothetical protein